MIYRFTARYYYLGVEVFNEEISAPSKVLAEFKAKVRSVAYASEVGRKLKYKLFISDEIINNYSPLIDCKNMKNCDSEVKVKNIS